MNSNSITELKLENINYLQNEINKIDSDFKLSCFNLYTWKHYNNKIYFFVSDEAIYLYLYDKELPKIQKSKIIILRPIIKQENEFKIKDYYKKSLILIEKDLKQNSCIKQIQFGTFNEKDLLLFKRTELMDTFNAAYLYPTKQLKDMSGKKMQKKRNFVNFYKKNYEQDSRIEKYNPLLNNEIIKFCAQESIDKESQETREYEIDALKEILEFNRNKGYGSILFYKNEIIGFTYGFINNNKYEIFIEKANKNFKGSYQYLMTKNLEINNIQTSLIDRQDDMYNDNLMKSKLSYKPIDIVHIYFFKAFSDNK